MRLRESLDIKEDPYVKSLRSEPGDQSSKQLQKAILSRKTYCQEQLKTLSSKGQIVEEELGTWAADWYINACIRKFKLGLDGGSVDLSFFKDEEKDYLLQCLIAIEPKNLDTDFPTSAAKLSPKVRKLIEHLLVDHSSDFTGLIFVRTRAEVAVLSHLLSENPLVKRLYSISTFVGTSNVTSRKASIGELVDVRNQKDTLDDLRRGQKNLVITTSALEEGIDVSACNSVICFEKPPNLKSVIQRRGRARKSASKFVLMLADDVDPSTITTWQTLEEEMHQKYLDDMRILQKLDALEAVDEGEKEFIVESTGAKLLMSNAVSHLYRM